MQVSSIFKGPLGAKERRLDPVPLGGGGSKNQVPRGRARGLRRASPPAELAPSPRHPRQRVCRPQSASWLENGAIRTEEGLGQSSKRGPGSGGHRAEY